MGTTSMRAEGFEAIADTIMYRWSAERDVWVSPSEVEQARAYLQRVGVATSPLPDGRFAVGGSTAATLAATRVVLLGLRHLHSTRRGRRPASARGARCRDAHERPCRAARARRRSRSAAPVRPQRSSTVHGRR